MKENRLTDFINLQTLIRVEKRNIIPHRLSRIIIRFVHIDSLSDFYHTFYLQTNRLSCQISYFFVFAKHFLLFSRIIKWNSLQVKLKRSGTRLHTKFIYILAK